MKFSLLLTVVMLLLAGCAEKPKLFWGVDEGKGDESTSASSAPQAASRPALIVPPELRRDQASVPEAKDVAVEPSMPGRYHQEVAGKQVALDARVYPMPVAQLFSTVVDAMTALNLPVQSVDSPSGTITSDWVRTGANNANAVSATVGNMFGSGPSITRYRFVVRVLRQGAPGAQEQARLEVRTVSQAYINNHWVNRKLARDHAAELFSAVEERLGIAR